MKTALVVRTIDQNLAVNSVDPGDFWKHALIENNIKDVDLFDSEAGISLNKMFINKLSYHFIRRKIFDVFKKSEKRFLDFLDQKHYDMILFHKGEYVRKELLHEIKKRHKDTLLINIFPDNIFFYFVAYQAVPSYDYFFVKDTFMLKELSKSGYNNCYYLPMAFSTKYHYKIPEKDISKKERQKYSSDVSFIGSIYPQRQRILENLKGFNIKIWGKSIWDSVDKKSWIFKYHQKQLAEGEMKSKIFSCSKINLNTHHYQNDIHGTNNRLHEIPACGGFQLCDYKKDLPDLYKIGKEIAVFHDAKELRQQVQYYLDNPSERKNIAKAGQKRALKDHSYTKRIEQVFNIVNKKS